MVISTQLGNSEHGIAGNRQAFGAADQRASQPGPKSGGQAMNDPETQARRRKALRVAIFLGILALLFYGGSVLYIIFVRGQIA